MRAVELLLFVVMCGLALAVAGVFAWTVWAFVELGEGRHRAPNRGMPIPLSLRREWPPPPVLIPAPRPAEPATEPMPAPVVKEFDKLRAMIDAGPWTEGPA